MTRAFMILVLLLAGCSGGNADMPPPATQVHQPATNPPPTTPAPTTNPPPPAPAATVNAGPDQTVKLGATVARSGTSDTTEELPAYLWQFISLPQGSGTTLKDPMTLTPTFAPDLVGLYVVRLTLDGTAADDVTVDVQANLLALRFSGTFGPDGTFEGTVSYEVTQGPNARNI